MTNVPNDPAPRHVDLSSVKIPKKSKHKGLKIFLIILLVLAILVGGLVGAFFALKESGRRALHTQTAEADPLIENLPENLDVTLDESDDNLVIYNGHTYRFNENITSVLCMGVDPGAGIPKKPVQPGSAGQADAVFLLAIDQQTGAATVIAISRDTAADIDVYSVGNTFAGTERHQLCLAYAYGDGRQTSCENTLRAVSRAMYGLDIASYAAFDMNSLSYMNDAVGGVTVTPKNDAEISGVILKAGKPHRLEGREVLKYVRWRDNTVLDSNTERMQHQKEFLQGFFSQAITKTKSDITTPVKLYNSLSKSMVTNVTAAEVTYLTTCFLNGDRSGLTFRTVEGEVSADPDGKAIFTPDDKALYELILDVFYRQES